MKQTVSLYEFTNAFHGTQYENNFTYEGLKALYTYLDELEEETGEELELDIVALCCDFSEYESLEEFRENYSSDYETMQDIEAETTVIYIDEPESNGRFIAQDS